MDNFERANKYFHKGDYENALIFYKTSIEKYGNEPVVLYNIGTCLVKLKKYNEAIEYFQQAIKIRCIANCFYNIGYCHMKLEEYRDALRMLGVASALYLKETGQEDEECENAIKLLVDKMKLNVIK